jgi:uncharacterized membrane protein YedE/YeeE
MTANTPISYTTAAPVSSAAPVSEGVARYVVVGALFGIVLVKGEVVSWYRIQEMFRFQGFHMYGILLSAMITAMIALRLLALTRLRSLTGEVIAISPKVLGTGRRYVFGGFLFGIGWALAGACPGPLWALVGVGSGAFVVVAVAALAGTWTYGILRPRLPH